MQSPKAYITNIRQEIEASRNTRLWQDSINMLSTISESIFSRSAHFILELLQNAEDACLRIRRSSGRITFRISPDRIRVAHNGAPFNQADVSAICGVRSSKKPEEETLGYLGIGFKSVFKVSDRPEIHSGGFHFKFAKSDYADPSSQPWQITPIWVNEVSEDLDEELTTFLIPFRSPEAYEQTQEELRKLDVHIFLFLKWLKKLEITYEPTGEATVIENRGEKNGIVSLVKNGEGHRFIIFRRTSDVPANVATDLALAFYRRQHVTQREVVLAFGVNLNDYLTPIEDASTLGSVSSFLPLVEERSGAKFLIQSDFLVQPGREAIQYELSWNHWLIGEVVEVAKQAIEEFKKNAKWRNHFLPLFNFTPYSGQPAFEKLFGSKLHQPLTAYLTSAEVYATASGAHVRPDQAVQLEEGLIGLVIDADLPCLFPGRADLGLADPHLEPETLPTAIKSLAKQVTLGQVARNAALLKTRASHGDINFFVKLYTAMAESTQDFRRETRRDIRGRYSSYESPIYVLTDTKIALSDDVYLREIPAEVLGLRTKFTEVERVLSSYEFIHPALAIPELVRFFKECTHVKSIDYDKICREVFLPRLRPPAPPPRKDELIAYTRLLQKGPPLSGQIWILTRSGNSRPSNQVFLGTDYSPSEDWEKFSKYCQGIDFLSPEYLQGVSQAEVATWKELFTIVGVRERADNPYVRDFAMAFAQEKLTPELTNFIYKDHQQHGYDLEARRLTDNSVVYLEVKGQKKEGPIDLGGNEPEAAKQAQQKGQAFWLCVVPGIPENPQLWVVDDPLRAGESKTVTIDVSKWKAYGRRVH